MPISRTWEMLVIGTSSVSVSASETFNHRSAAILREKVLER